MDRFEIGKTYGVLGLESQPEPAPVTIASRTDTHVTLTDGTKHKIRAGVAPDEGTEEMFRMNECGPIGQVVRVCHLQGEAA